MIRRPPPDLVVDEDLDGFELTLFGDPRRDSTYVLWPALAAIGVLLAWAVAMLGWGLFLLAFGAMACIQLLAVAQMIRIYLGRYKTLRITANELVVTQRTRPTLRVPLGAIGRCNVHTGPQLWLRIAGEDTLRLDLSASSERHVSWLAQEIEAAARGARERTGDRSHVPTAIERLR